MLSCSRRALGIFAIAASASLSHAQFAHFAIEAEHASGQLRGQAFADQPLTFNFLMDTQTGTATFGGGGGSTIYDQVATSAWLDLGSEQFAHHGLGRLFLTQDEGFDYLVADIFGLHTTFWRLSTDGPFTDPAFERPLNTVLIPGKYVPLLIDPRFGDVLPNRITGTYTATDGEVTLAAAQIRSLSLSIVPSPGTAAAGIAAILTAAVRRRRRH